MAFGWQVVWKNDATAVLPVYLVAVAVPCLHFTEEYVTAFQHQFPKLMGGSNWSAARCVTFNMLWLPFFVLAGVGVYRRWPMAYVAVIFLALIGGVANGASHLLLQSTGGISEGWSQRRFACSQAPYCL